MKDRLNLDDRVPTQQLLVFGMGGLIPIALFNIAGQLIGLIGNISLGLSAFWLGAILIVPRLWDAVSDPVVGHLSDNTRSRWGRRRPFILVGGITVALSFMMMWWIPNDPSIQAWFPSHSAFQWFQLSYILVSLLIFFTACTLFEIPHGALGMELTSNPHERTRLFSAKSFFGNLFAMATPWIFALAELEIFRGPGGTEADGMRYVSLIIAAVLIPASIFWFLLLREPSLTKRNVSALPKNDFWTDMKHTTQNKTFILLVMVIFSLAMGFNFVSLLGYYISIFYLYGGDKSAAGALLGINGTVWAVVGLLAVFPLNWISPRLGKRNTLILAIGLMCAAQLSKIFCYNPNYPYLVIIPTVLLSTGMLFFFTLGSSMVGDVCDEDDLNTGMRSEGCYYSVYWWFIKMGTAFASFVTGLLIVFSQFDETQVTRVDELNRELTKIQLKEESWESRLDSFLKSEKRSEQVAWLSNFENEIAAALEKNRNLASKIKKSVSFAQKANSVELNQVQRIWERTKYYGSQLEKNLASLAMISKGDSQDELKMIVQSFAATDLSLQIEQTILSAIALQAHLSSKESQDQNSKVHLTMLLNNVEFLKQRLASLLEKSDSPEKILLSAKELVPTLKSTQENLKRQTPESLFRMRAVEIGLPVLLSLISLFFALKYPLTDERCREIQAALRDRNQSA